MDRPSDVRWRGQDGGIDLILSLPVPRHYNVVPRDRSSKFLPVLNVSAVSWKLFKQSLSELWKERKGLSLWQGAWLSKHFGDCRSES